MKKRVDKVIGHTKADRRKKPRVRFEDIDEAIAAIKETYEQYYTLLRAIGFDTSPPPVDIRSDLRKIWPPKP